MYAGNAKDWLTNLAPVGAAAQYVRAGKVDPLPLWYPLNEYTVRDRIFANGYRGPLSWYKSAMRGLNADDEAAISENDRFCHIPTLLVVSTDDYVSPANIMTAQTQKWCTDMRVETVEGCGHWIQLEQPEKLFQLMKSLATEVTEPKPASNGTAVPAAAV